MTEQANPAEDAHPPVAPDFSLVDHLLEPYTLRALMGEKGLLLGFVRDIWLPSSVRRIQWLQRNTQNIRRLGVRLAMIICNQPHTLHNFYITSPVPAEFPLLADADRRVSEQYEIRGQGALIVVDAARIERARWWLTGALFMPEMARLTETLALL